MFRNARVTFIKAILDSVANRRLKHLRLQHEIICQCPWCLQTAQEGKRYACREVEKSGNKLMLITCGNCRGTSYWRNENGRLEYVNALEPPAPAFVPDPSIDVGRIWSDKDRDIKNMRAAAIDTDRKVCQILAPVLGYRRYMEDQDNFPGSTEDDGYYTGGESAESMATMAAGIIGKSKKGTKKGGPA